MRYSILIGIMIAALFIISSFVIFRHNNESLIIQTDLYEVSVPNNWTVELSPSFSLSFKQSSKELGGYQTMGGLQILGYYPDEPISHIYPNQEVIYSKDISGFFTDTIQAKFKITPPAAAHEDWVKEEMHIYFLIKDQNIAYDIWFDLDYVDEKMALNIAKSFRLKK